MRKVQIRDNLHCDFIEYVSQEDFNEAMQIEVNEEDLLEIGVTKQFDLSTLTLIPYNNSKDIRQREARKQINELKSKLQFTDYQAIKFAEGILTEFEYAPIREQRKQWRLEVNELEKELEE